MDAKRPSDESARTALFLLSETISSYHEINGSQICCKVLQARTSRPQFRSRRLSANDAGNYDEAVEQSIIAEKAFSQSANMPAFFEADLNASSPCSLYIAARVVHRRCHDTRTCSQQFLHMARTPSTA